MRDELAEASAIFDSTIAEQAAQIARLEEELQLRGSSDREREAEAQRQREADGQRDTQRARSPVATSGTPLKEASTNGEPDTQTARQRQRDRHRDAQVVSDELDSRSQSRHGHHWSASTSRSVVRSMAERRINSPQRSEAHAPPHTPPQEDAV